MKKNTYLDDEFNGVTEMSQEIIDSGEYLTDEEYEKYIGLAKHLTKKYQGWNCYEDIVCRALDGVAIALKRYKPEKGCFSTYCRWWVKAEVGKYLAIYQNAARIPVNVHCKMEFISPVSFDAPMCHDDMKHVNSMGRERSSGLHEKYMCDEYAESFLIKLKNNEAKTSERRQSAIFYIRVTIVIYLKHFYDNYSKV